MRELLQARDGVRGTYRGTVVRFGTKRGWKGTLARTILLRDVMDVYGQPVTDHLWFNLTKGFEALDLQPGERVQFDARVSPYHAGYRGYDWDRQQANPPRVDYHLSHPLNVRRVDDRPLEELPLFAARKGNRDA